MNWRDALERLFWTAVAAVLAAVPSIITDLPYWWVPVLTPVVNWALIWVRSKVPVLPNPGAGLPGLPT